MLTREQFFQAGAQFRPLLAREREMAAQIQEGYRPDCLATALSADQAVGHLVFAGDGATGLGATDIHGDTLLPPGGRCNRVP